MWCGELTQGSTHAMLWALAQATGADPTPQLERFLASLQCYLWPASVDPQPGKRGPFKKSWQLCGTCHTPPLILGS